MAAETQLLFMLSYRFNLLYSVEKKSRDET